jgi:uncharacterized protein (TIGR03066 family)
MNTRCFLLPAAFVLCSVSGCSQPSELPQAPEPRAKKSAAELLVGTWKVVEWKGKPAPNKWSFYREFTADGKFRILMDDRKNPPTDTSGTYQVVGESVHLHTPSDPQGKERKWEVSICLITEDTLEISFTEDGVTEKTKFQKVAEKGR